MSANSLSRRCSCATVRSYQYHCLPNTGWKRRPSDGCLRSTDLSELLYGLTYDTICFECHLMAPVLSTGIEIQGRGIYIVRQNGISGSVADVSSDAVSRGSRWPFPLPFESKNSILST